jgi:GT2 family glycosyltransferase
MTDVIVAVAVVAWNSSGVIGDLLASLDDGLAGSRWHLTVADNASDDYAETAAILDRWSLDHEAVPCRIVQTGRNAGYAAGINAALAAAEPYTAALVLNPDIRLAAGCVPALLAHLDGTTGIVVPRVLDERGALSHSLRREPSLPRAVGEAVLGWRAGRIPWLGETILDEADYRTATTVDWATGAIMLISAHCLTACGPWDESFFLYSEETEFALRARDHGYVTRLAPDAVATHLGGDSRVSPALWSLLTLNRVRLYRRRHPPLAAAAYWCAVLLREVPRAALGKRRSRHAVAALLGLHPARRRRPANR